jgi:hypothetical protein
MQSESCSTCDIETCGFHQSQVAGHSSAKQMPAAASQLACTASQSPYLASGIHSAGRDVSADEHAVAIAILTSELQILNN